MPIKGLNQVALPQAKAKLERPKFNVVSAARMWAHVSSVSLCFLLTLAFANVLQVGFSASENSKYLKGHFKVTDHDNSLTYCTTRTMSLCFALREENSENKK